MVPWICYKSLKNGKYLEMATLKAITTILPNNFEFQLCFVLQVGDDLIEDPLMKDSSGDEVRTDAVTLSKILNFCLSRPFRVFDLPSCSFVF